MDLSSMEQGVKLVGTTLVNRNLNKWGVKNILRSAWKEYEEVEIKWVKDNTFIIKVQDESVATKIIDQVPWAMMKRNFSIKRWHSELALEEVSMENIPFWVQIRGVFLCLTTESNIHRLTNDVGEFIELEDPSKAQGFLRVKLNINTSIPLVCGCWLRRTNNRDTWVRYERLQDFCYRCRGIGHSNTECSFEQKK